MSNTEQDFDPKSLNKSQNLYKSFRMQNPEGVRANDLMDKYAIDDRTLRRYITDLAGIN